VLSTLLPLYGAVFGYLIHHETVTPRTALGGLIILSCVAFETARHARG
jgi:drug/metabolite transporter (DMT)-like permease